MFFVLAALVPLSLYAHEPQPLSVKDIVTAREFGQLTAPQFSPSGRLLVYEATATRDGNQASFANATGVQVPRYAKNLDLYIADTATLKTENLTRGTGDNWCPSWSPDGRSLAFLSDRDGSGIPKLWVWDQRSGSLRKVSDLEIQSNQIEWLPNSSAVLVAAHPAMGVTALSNPSDAPLRRDEAPKSSSVVVYSANLRPSNIGFRHDSDPWSLGAYLRDLAVINVADGRVNWIVKGQRIGEYALSPDGSDVAYSFPLRFEVPGSQQIRWNLCVVSMSAGQRHIVASNIRLEYDGSPFTWSPDSSRLAYLIGGPMERSGAGDCYVVDRKGGSPKNLTQFRRKGVIHKQLSPLWDAQGRFIFFIHQGGVWKADANGHRALNLVEIAHRRAVELAAMGRNQVWSPDDGKSAVALIYDELAKQSGFDRLDLETGQTKRLLENGQCFSCINADYYVFGSIRTNRIAYFAEDAQHNMDLWVADAAFQHPLRITHLNPQLDKYQMGSARLISWWNDEGNRLHGALLVPPNYKKTKHYPLIVWVYGGEYGSEFLDSFGLSDGTLNLQLLATRGYAVLFPDAPQHSQTPMRDLAKDILPGINKVIDMGIADPSRLGVVGHSYGGYSAVALIVQTNRFKAAVDIDGPTNLLAEYGEMEKDGAAFGISVLEQEQGLMKGTPWQVRNKYIENSPLFYFDHVETPLLIVEGEMDEAVPPFLTDEAFVALRRLGKTVEYTKYKGEGHSPLYWKPENRADLAERIIAWFNQYLGNVQK